MSTAPSQRRGLPQPCAVNRSVSSSPVAPLGAIENVAIPIAAKSSSQSIVRTTTYVFRKSAGGPPQRSTTTTTTTTAATSTSAAARALSYQHYGEAQNCEANAALCSAGESGFTRPAAATFPWSSRPAPSTTGMTTVTAATGNGGRLMMRPTHYNENSSHCNNNDSNIVADGPSFVDLSATPEQRRCGHGVSRVSDDHHEQPSDSNSNFYQIQQRLQGSSQYVDPSAKNGAAATDQPGGSSLVFALSEDSELKVLASRVGFPPATHAMRAVASPTRVAQPTVLHRAMQQGAPYPTSSHRVGAPNPPMPTAGDATFANCLPHNGMARSAQAASQPQPHTPNVYRAAEGEDGSNSSNSGAVKPSVQVARIPRQQQQCQYASSTGTSSGSASPPPQQQQQKQRHSSAMVRPPRSLSGVPLYRSYPQELPSPPALHVCPGGVPGTGVVPSIGSGSSNNNNNTRWVPNVIPSVSLYSPAPPTATATTVANRANNIGTHGNVSSAILDGGGSAKGAPNRTLSNDARSPRSSTPLLPAFAAKPVEKNFTPAQLEAVQRDVQQELYLNYTAVPIPAEMVNLGDTDERRRRLEQRQKQIVYGKETEGYAKYIHLVPRVCDREYHNPLHALTPRPEYDCSKRQFDRVLNAWRRQLHQWDDCDLDHPDPKFLPAGTATLLDLALAEAPASHTPATATPTAHDKPPLQPSGVMHSIANVAAMAHDNDSNTASGAAHDGDDEDDGGVSHTRSPVFTGNTLTSALYSSGLSVHINSGRASAITAAACTPSRPQMSEGAEGPQVDDSFFFHMNSSNSRIASPFHSTYSGTGHVANGNGSGTSSAYYYNNYATANGSGSCGVGGMANGRSNVNTYYQQFMRNNNNSNYPHHNGGTPGSSYAMYTGLTPAHRPPSRGNAPHHITAIFGSEYELMTPSGPGSPSGLPHNSRNGGSPYRLGEPWMPNRRSPTYAMSSAAATTAAAGSAAATATTAQGSGHHVIATTINSSTIPANNYMMNCNGSSTTALSSITAANSAGTIVITGNRGESPSHTTELALIPSTSQSNSGGFAQSPYGFRVHSPVQPQQQQQSTPLTRSQSRPAMTTSAHQLSSSPSRSPIGLPPHLQQQQPQQQQRVAIATTMAAVARSRRGSGPGAAPTTWTPPNPQAQVRPSPHTPQLHLSATLPSTKRPDVQERE